MEFFPLGELCMYALLIGFPPLEDDSVDLPMGLFSISQRESNPSAVGFLPLGVPTLQQGFFPLKVPV